MSALSFRLAAAFVLAGVSCAGTAADIYPFEGSSWRIASINGESTPSSRYMISFGGNQVTGRVGCNDFGGKLVAGESTLSVADLRATSRNCGDTAALLEGSAFAVLSQPLRMVWASRDQLTIASSEGSMTLERMRLATTPPR